MQVHQNHRTARGSIQRPRHQPYHTPQDGQATASELHTRSVRPRESGGGVLQTPESSSATGVCAWTADAARTALGSVSRESPKPTLSSLSAARPSMAPYSFASAGRPSPSVSDPESPVTASSLFTLFTPSVHLTSSVEHSCPLWLLRPTLPAPRPHRRLSALPVQALLQPQASPAAFAATPASSHRSGCPNTNINLTLLTQTPAYHEHRHKHDHHSSDHHQNHHLITRQHSPNNPKSSRTGFWNIPARLNPSRGIKYRFFERAARVSG